MAASWRVAVKLETNEHRGLSGAIDDLPDDALVIRGAPMDPQRILRRATKDRDFLAGAYGISAFAASSTDTTLADLVSLAGLPHPTLRKSTVGRIIQAGFRVYRTGRWPHCTIDLGDEPDEDAIVRLIAAFDLDEPTPGRERQS